MRARRATIPYLPVRYALLLASMRNDKILRTILAASLYAVRDAKRKLEERRETLREVKLEEMDIGIKIARARRREDFDDGEGSLWVRRVTG